MGFFSTARSTIDCSAPFSVIGSIFFIPRGYLRSTDESTCELLILVAAAFFTASKVPANFRPMTLVYDDYHFGECPTHYFNAVLPYVVETPSQGARRRKRVNFKELPLEIVWIKEEAEVGLKIGR
jgi:hypothetical protein